MNWYKIVKFAASPKNVVIKYQLNPEEDAMLIFWIYQNANNPNIPWNEFKDKNDINNFINSVLIKNLLDTKLNPEGEGTHYVSIEEGKKILQREIENANPQNQEMQQAIQMYRQDQDSGAKKIVDTINQNKAESFTSWIEYLTTQYSEYPAFVYTLLNAVADSSPSTKQMEPLPANSLAIATLFDSIKNNPVKYSQIKIIKTYKNEVEKADEAKSGHLSINDEKGNRWRLIPSKEKSQRNPKKYGTFEDNKEILKHYGNLGQWCVGGERWANDYLSYGDFYIYLVEGQPKVAIRFSNDQIAEIRGQNNQSELLIPYWEDTQKFLQDNGWEDDAKNAGGYDEIANIIEMNNDFVMDVEKRKKMLDGIKNGNLELYAKLSKENKQGEAFEAASSLVNDLVNKDVALIGGSGSKQPSSLLYYDKPEQYNDMYQPYEMPERDNEEEEKEEEIELVDADTLRISSLFRSIEDVPEVLQNQEILNKIIFIFKYLFQGDMNTESVSYDFIINYYTRAYSNIPQIIRQKLQNEEKTILPEAIKIYVKKYLSKDPFDTLKGNFHPDFHDIFQKFAEEEILNRLSGEIVDDAIINNTTPDTKKRNFPMDVSYDLRHAYSDGQDAGIDPNILEDAYANSTKQLIQYYYNNENDVQNDSNYLSPTLFLSGLLDLPSHETNSESKGILINNPKIQQLLFPFINKILPNIREESTKTSYFLDFLLTVIKRNTSVELNRAYVELEVEYGKLRKEHYQDTQEQMDDRTKEHKRRIQEIADNINSFDVGAKKINQLFMSPEMQASATQGAIHDIVEMGEKYDDRRQGSSVFGLRQLRNFNADIINHMPNIAKNEEYQQHVINLVMSALEDYEISENAVSQEQITFPNNLYIKIPKHLQIHPQIYQKLLTIFEISLRKSPLRYVSSIDKEFFNSPQALALYKKVFIERFVENIGGGNNFKSLPYYKEIMEEYKEQLTPRIHAFIDEQMVPIERDHNLILNSRSYSRPADLDEEYTRKKLSEIANNALQYDPALYEKVVGSHWRSSSMVVWNPEMVEKYVRPYFTKHVNEFGDLRQRNPASVPRYWMRNMPDLEDIWIQRGVETIVKNPLALSQLVDNCVISSFGLQEDKLSWCSLLAAIKRMPEFETSVIQSISDAIVRNPSIVDSFSKEFREFLTSYPNINEQIVRRREEQKRHIYDPQNKLEAKSSGWYKKAISFSLPEKIRDVILSENIFNVPTITSIAPNPIEFNDALGIGIQMAFQALPETKFTPNHRSVIVELRKFLSANQEPQVQQKNLPIEKLDIQEEITQEEVPQQL